MNIFSEFMYYRLTATNSALYSQKLIFFTASDSLGGGTLMKPSLWQAA
jgi:hypothetical protein